MDLLDFCGISIHAPRTGSDLSRHGLARLLRHFNPRSPHGERPRSDDGCKKIARYFNPRSPHGERHVSECKRLSDKRISIHAPRTGSDDNLQSVCVICHISIHAPRTGSDLAYERFVRDLMHISIHAPRTGSDAARPLLVPTMPISIHAPRTGSDLLRNLRALCEK